MTDSTSRYAKELHRRRVIAGDVSPYSKAFAEISFLFDYEQPISIDNLHIHGGKVHVGASDLDDRAYILLFSDEGREWAVSTELVYDVYVFLGSATNSSGYDILGWLPYDEVVQAPEVNECFLIESNHLMAMPVELDFKPSCPSSPCDEAAVWDNETASWWCAMCPRHRYNKHDRELIARQRSAVHEKQEGN